MSRAADSRPEKLSASRLTRRPHLRLVAEGPAATAGDVTTVSVSGEWQGEDHVLVAGADETTRARMLAELRSVLPRGTHFAEASETWEVVARASDSRMVVLAGDLGETSCSSLLRLLARRNPTLPVLAVGASERHQALDAAHA